MFNILAVQFLCTLFYKWIEIKEYEFFDSYQMFWVMIEDYCNKWKQENPLEYDLIMNTESLKKSDLICIVIVSMKTSKYLSENDLNIEFINKYNYALSDKNWKPFDPKLAEGCYHKFVNHYQIFYGRDIFTKVTNNDS